MVNHPLVRFVLFVLAVAVIAALVIGAAWGFWVMFFAWNLDKNYARLVILATSSFWLCIGGLLWLKPNSRQKD